VDVPVQYRKADQRARPPLGDLSAETRQSGMFIL
jgi:hypothetical protein